MESTMLDTSLRDCVEEEGACEGWRQPGVNICPGDCPERMSILTTDSPEEVREIHDIWYFTWEMLLLPEWTEVQASVVFRYIREWLEAGRDGNRYAEGCIGMLGRRLFRFGMYSG